MSSPEGSTILFRRIPGSSWHRSLTVFARRLQKEVAKGQPFTCLITNDAELRRLNLEFRGSPDPTDVLSFPSGGVSSHLGDLAISLPRARAQARTYGHTTEDELRILMLHGLLHLLGMDHESDTGLMLRSENRWRARLGLPNGVIERVRS